MERHLPSTYTHFGSHEPVQRTWHEIWSLVTSTSNDIHRYTQLSRQARAEGRTAEAARLKASCGMFTPACQCRADRKAEHLVGLTLVGMVDLDHVAADVLPATLERVRTDRHTFFCQVTNSQQGIRILFRYQLAQSEPEPTTPEEMTHLYLQAWRVGNDYYARLTGQEPDRSCKDTVRASFFCHDAEAYLCEEAEPFTVGAAASVPNTDESSTHDVNLLHITQLIKQHPYVPSARHQFWVKLGARLRYLGIERTQMTYYQRAALSWLGQRGQILSDDPSLRKPSEIDDAMAWGYDHGHDVLPQDAAEEVTEPCDENIIEQQCPKFPQQVYQSLPILLQQGLTPLTCPSAASLPQRRKDALLMSLLTNISALCAETHLAYGTHDYSPNLAFICLSVAGNGKSEMAYGFRLVEQVDAYLEQQSRQAHRQWQDEMDQYQLAMQDRRLSREEKAALTRPADEPQDQLLIMPGTTSRSQFTLCMNAMGRDGLIINSTEIRTICATLKLDVGDFSDLLCKAMSNERIDQFFKTDMHRIKIEHPKLSVCMSGTFDQFHDFIPSYENGLFSRFGFMMMEPHIEWISQMPDAEHGRHNKLYEQLAQECLTMWQMLRRCPTQVQFTAAQWHRHDVVWSQQLQTLVREGGDDLVSVINRHGLMQMRIASVLTVLRKWEAYQQLLLSWPDSVGALGQEAERNFASQYAVMWCSEEDFVTAQLIATTLLQHALHLSTTMAVKANPQVLPMQEWPWAIRCLKAMPPVFETPAFVQLAEQQFGRSRGHIFKSIRELRKQGYIRQRKRGYYEVVASRLQEVPPAQCD